MNLGDKVVLITGSSGGLGAQTCYEVAKQGTTVISRTRRMAFVEGVRGEYRRPNGKEAYAFKINVSDPYNVSELYEKAMEEVGRVDVLVNNISFNIFEGFLIFDLGKVYDMLEVNILGMMVLIRKFAINTAERRQGHIINIALMAGKMAAARLTVYSITKFAILGLFSALRLELKLPGVAVTTVNPDPIETDFFDKTDPSGSYLEKVGQIVLELTKLAEMIIRNIEHPKQGINQSFILEVAPKLYMSLPTTGNYLANGIFNKK